jgi:hypothetical protein
MFNNSTAKKTPQQRGFLVLAMLTSVNVSLQLAAVVHIKLNRMSRHVQSFNFATF